ncbi:MAG: hypothetical protein MPJ50_05010 [Pirellulales bacterium]|nr:hypothetical protein [Pirellulales bacterium]
MTGDSISVLDSMAYADLCLVDSVCDRFEAAFRAGSPPSIHDEVALVETRLQRIVFREVLWRAFELHADSGSPQTLEEICRPSCAKMLLRDLVAVDGSKLPGRFALQRELFAPSRAKMLSRVPG